MPRRHQLNITTDNFFARYFLFSLDQVLISKSPLYKSNHQELQSKIEKQYQHLD